MAFELTGMAMADFGMETGGELLASSLLESAPALFEGTSIAGAGSLGGSAAADLSTYEQMVNALNTGAVEPPPGSFTPYQTASLTDVPPPSAAAPTNAAPGFGSQPSSFGQLPADVTAPTGYTPTPEYSYDKGLSFSNQVTQPSALGQTSLGQPAGPALNAGVPSTAPGALTTTTPPSDFMNGLKSVGEFAKANPFTTGALGYGVLSATGALNPKQQTFQQSGITFKNPYTISPNFQGTHPNPSQYQYAAHYADGGLGTVEEMSRENATGSNQMFPQANLSGLTGMNTYQNPTNTPMSSNVIGPTDTPTDPYTGAMRFAGGGIADVPRFKTGGMDIYDASQRFASMYDPHAAPAEKGDAGIFRDDSPTTRYLQAFPAAQAKLNAINKRAYVNTPQYKTPTSMSQLGGLNFTTPGQKPDNSTDNTESVLAANGGIMGYSLGGYAHGGNPRLLRGPGDGVSDSIPATIADRQPARLADGEFVVPARIVSELGNGSTEAGAKRLHEMMNNVQKARSKTVGKGNIAVDSKAYKAIPKK